MKTMTKFFQIEFFFTSYGPKFGKNQKVYIQIQIPFVVVLRFILLLLCEKHKFIP